MKKLKVTVLTDLVRQINAAKQLGISKQHVYALIKAGKLTVYDIDGMKFVSRSEIQERLEANKLSIDRVNNQ